MKHLLLLFICCGLAATATAQRAAGPTPLFSRVTKVRFGAKLGLNVSNTDFNRGVPAPPVAVATTWKPNVVAGFTMQVPISQTLSVQPEYLFSRMGGKRNDSGAEYQLSYLSLPVLLKYSFASRFAVLAGPQFDLLIQANQRVNGSSTNITHDTEERSVGATAGLEFYLLPNLSITGRYLYGLNHVGIGQRSAVTEFVFEAVQFSTDFKF